MRILHVITSLNIGGAEKLIVDIVPRLQDSGHQVDVCLFNGENTPFKQRLLECGCQIISFSNNTHYFSLSNLLKLHRLVKSYDIVHTHNTAPQLFGAIAGKRSSALLVTTEHSSNNRRRRYRCLKVVDRWMYNQYDKIICISNQAEINLRTYLGKSDSKIITIPNGVDVSSFHSAKSSQLIEPASNRMIVVMVAGFRKEKDHDTLVKAMSHLDPNCYELWLVGDGERMDEVKRLANNLGLQDNVRFLGIRSDIPNILQSADVVVMSSHWEGLSLSSIEGMAVEKPFIASDVDGLREITEGAGLLFRHKDDKQLSELIALLRNNRDLYNITASACYERAKQYDISTTVRAYRDVYDELMREK